VVCLLVLSTSIPTVILMPDAILFTSSVLNAASDHHKDILDATRVTDGGLTYWPAYYLDVGQYSWLANTNLSALSPDLSFEGRVSAVSALIATFHPSISFEDSRDLATQLCSIFHEQPTCSIASDDPHSLYQIALRRCKYVGELKLTLPHRKHYVTTNEEQLEEWVKGNPLHNYAQGLCCPDFSCCSPDLLISESKRIAFSQAKDNVREAMLPSLLSSALDKLL
jgi:hypothetical protein